MDYLSAACFLMRNRTTRRTNACNRERTAYRMAAASTLCAIFVSMPRKNAHTPCLSYKDINARSILEGPDTCNTLFTTNNGYVNTVANNLANAPINSMFTVDRLIPRLRSKFDRDSSNANCTTGLDTINSDGSTPLLHALRLPPSRYNSYTVCTNGLLACCIRVTTTQMGLVSSTLIQPASDDTKMDSEIERVACRSLPPETARRNSE
mmetsp:Transcript_1810/g.3234  ORF Transcript_1810/g.3234 Transcript_1810/m.3234 type:complete len:208 (+) Transcript_1810:679-1302(+)